MTANPTTNLSLPDALRPAVTTAVDRTGGLRWLCDGYRETQKLRIALGNRSGAIKRGTDTGPMPRSLSALLEGLEGAEDAIRHDMDEVLRDHPAMRWLGGVRGVGPTLACKVLGQIEDIGTFDTVSKLWRYSGYAVIDGKRERPKAAECPDCGAPGRRRMHTCPVSGQTVEIKGLTLPYSVRMKTAVYLVACSFLKCAEGSRAKKTYREAYDRAKARYEQREAAKPDAKQRWTKGHIHLAAMRVVSKLFLSHLWQTWREAEGLPIRAAYVIEVLGHTAVSDPWDYVEPSAS